MSMMPTIFLPFSLLSRAIHSKSCSTRIFPWCMSTLASRPVTEIDWKLRLKRAGKAEEGGSGGL
jgi:hypothetical protein